eukprot:c13219_g1_i1.p1 GENE.c13219_g1_i1~~c13219_g1_i1.p1  ORF type:complete len:369 (-),score=106.35 c13219_g1_i1:77-1183(-)
MGRSQRSNTTRSTMKACLFVLGVFVLAVHAQNAAQSLTPHSQQDRFLAKAATGNFGCRVNGVTVKTMSPAVGEPLVTIKDLQASFSDVATLEWAHIAQSSFASLDGRNDEKVLGTPGGDMGEFIQALNAYTKVSNQILSQEEVSAVFERYLKTMSRTKFFYETDERSYLNIAVAAGCRNLHVAEMGGLRHKRDAYLSVIDTPDYIGDRFIRFLARNSTDLGLVPQYVKSALAAYHKVLWTNPSEKASKLCYLQVKGPNTVGALVNIITPTYCVDQGLAPMASQQLACNAPVFINHPDAVKIFRRELVSVLTNGTVDPRDVLAAYNSLAQENLEKFWASVGDGLPIYNVEFTNSSPLLAEEVSFVDDKE